MTQNSSSNPKRTNRSLKDRSDKSVQRIANSAEERRGKSVERIGDSVEEMRKADRKEERGKQFFGRHSALDAESRYYVDLVDLWIPRQARNDDGSLWPVSLKISPSIPSSLSHLPSLRSALHAPRLPLELFRPTGPYFWLFTIHYSLSSRCSNGPA
jgi:hypothetical protein